MLAIVGSGEYLPPMNAVDRDLLDLFSKRPRVVCLPTAAGREGDVMIDSWLERGVAHFAALGADAAGARIWNRSTADDPVLADEVAGADFVYLSGGNPNYLHATLESTRVWQAILDVIGRGGLLAGCSAGAMIQGEKFVGLPRPHGGFGLWPGLQIVPHFDQIPTAVVAAMRAAVGRSHTLVGVNTDTALLSVDGTYRVIGNEVTVWTTSERTVHGPGELPADLLAS